MPTKKIAILITSLAFGGAERVVSLLNNELLKYFNVTLILLYDEIAFPLDKKSKVIVLSKSGQRPKKGIFSKLKDYSSLSVRYKKVLKEENIHVAISFLAIPNIINSLAKISNKNLKTIISERCFPSIYENNKISYFIAKTFFPILYNRNNLLFSNSIYINQELIENYNIKIATEVLYNPLHVTNTKPETKVYQKAGSNFKVVNVGRLSKQKNQKLLIDAFKLLPENYSLNIYGNGELRDDLITYSKELNLKNIEFIPSVSNIQDHLVKNHCFVLTSTQEGFPNVLLEAMSVGLPVISTNCLSGPQELLNDNEPINAKEGEFYKAKYGLIVNLNDPTAIAKAIKYFEANENVRENYSNLSFERAKSFDTPIIGLQFKDMINSI